jgi:hypothetical protein
MSMCNHNSVNRAIRGESFLKNFLESSLSLQTGATLRRHGICHGSQIVASSSTIFLLQQVRM